jgi:hypothetical protein
MAGGIPSGLFLCPKPRSEPLEQSPAIPAIRGGDLQKYYDKQQVNPRLRDSLGLAAVKAEYFSLFANLALLFALSGP